MFALLFSGLIEFALIVGGIYAVYTVFIKDWLNDKRQARQQEKNSLSSAQKIAQVKLISDDISDIENFINTNAAYLSDDMVVRLVNRMESLKCDHVIYDDVLKKRIDQAAAHLEDDFEPDLKQTMKS